MSGSSLSSSSGIELSLHALMPFTFQLPNELESQPFSRPHRKSQRLARFHAAVVAYPGIINILESKEVVLERANNFETPSMP